MAEALTRFEELKRFLQENHSYLQLMILALAFSAGVSDHGRTHVTKRMSMKVLLTLMDEPWNNSIHWSVLHLVGSMSLHNCEAQESIRRSGVLQHLCALMINSAHGNTKSDKSSDTSTITSTSSLSSKYDPYLNIGMPVGMDRCDICLHCHEHIVEVLFWCVHGNKQSCKYLFEDRAFRCLLLLSGLIPDGTSTTSSSSNIEENIDSKNNVCGGCRDSIPNIYTSYRPSLLQLLRGKNRHGEVLVLDVVAEILRYSIYLDVLTYYVRIVWWFRCLYRYTHGVLIVY